MAEIPRHIFANTLKELLLPIGQYLSDDAISEVMINGEQEIYIERGGKLEITDSKFDNPDQLMAAVKNIAQYVGKTIKPEQPRMDARLPDGSRVHVVIPPCSRKGIYMAIRKFSKEKLTIEKLLDYGSISKKGAIFLDQVVKLKKNIIVSGGTGSGKTSLLNVISSMIPARERIIVIEDTTELQLVQPHVINMETQPGDPKGRGKVTIRHLFQSAMRLRPDRIVIGEIRGGEALDVIQAMTSGHGGSMSTTHATYPTDTLHRLETMALMSEVELPHYALKTQIASAIEIIIQTSRFNDGSRKITHISEVLGLDENHNYMMEDIFQFKSSGNDQSGDIKGELEPTGYIPSFVKEVTNIGYPVFMTIFKPGKEHDIETDRIFNNLFCRQVGLQ